MLPLLLLAAWTGDAAARQPAFDPLPCIHLVPALKNGTTGAVTPVPTPWPPHPALLATPS